MTDRPGGIAQDLLPELDRLSAVVKNASVLAESGERIKELEEKLAVLPRMEYFVTMMARMKYDTEVTPGKPPYLMQPDDAIETLSLLIQHARGICRDLDRSKPALRVRTW